MNRRLLLSLITALSLATAGVGWWKYAHDHSELVRLEKDSAKAQEQAGFLRSSARGWRAQSERERRESRRLNAALRLQERQYLAALSSAPIPTSVQTAIAGNRRKLIPADAKIGQFHVLPQHGTLPSEVVALWYRDIPSSSVLDSGLLLWRATHLLQSTTRLNSIRLRWKAVYEIYLPGVRRSPGLIGPPSHPGQFDYDGQYALDLTVGDVTGDHRPDLLTMEYNDGSGGCGRYRVISDDGGTPRQIFWREHCEGPIDLVHKMLRIDGAVWPKGCDYAHGCGHYREWLRWDGSDWERISRSVEIDRETLRYYRAH